MSFCNVTDEDAALMLRTLHERSASSAMIPDVALLIAENLMRRYVTQREQQNPPNPDTQRNHQTTEKTDAEAVWYDAVLAESNATVRSFPYASLFLHPLPDGVREYAYSPPTSVLHHSPIGRRTGEGFRETFALHGGAEAMVTVLQGECGLAVTTGGGGNANAHQTSPLGMPSFLVSPDATSCVLVACRVGMHPRLRAILEAQRRSSPSGGRRSGPPEGDDASGGVGFGGEAEFEALRGCSRVFAASMAHFDTEHGLRRTLYEMLWEVALPAWIHTAEVSLRASKACTLWNAPQTSKREMMTWVFSLLRRLAEAVPLCHTPASRDPDTCHPSTAHDALLEVEWFIVGGIRLRECVEPLLTSIFRTFFTPETDHDVPSHVLSPSFRLSDLLQTPQTPSSSPTHDKEEEEADTVSISHRLREDGLCFWSLNTVLREWAIGPRGVRYACAATWGLLLDVAGGGCWPAQLEKGTRTYPLAALRHVKSAAYRWLCPLRCEGKLRVSLGTAATERAAGYFALQSFASAVHPTGKVTLETFVRRILQQLQRQQQPHKGTSGTAEQQGGTDTMKGFTLPVLARSVEWKMVDKKFWDGVPDVALLQCSTTPHCEPPDFIELTRLNFAVMGEFAAEDVFPKNTMGILV